MLSKIKVNLAKCQDTYIGAGDRFKGISGGEKRRLAFASEVLILLLIYNRYII